MKSIALSKLLQTTFLFLCFHFIILANDKIDPPNKINLEEVNFIVYYAGDVSQALDNHNAYMHTFIEVYELSVQSRFDEKEFKGFVLKAPKGQYDLIELAREISMIDEVMMVELDQRLE